MDPLSIAASVAGITAACLSTGKAIYDFSGKYQDAPRNLVAISSEAAVISALLSQIQALILTEQNPEQLLRSRPEIAATLDTALTGCMVLFTSLDEELREVSRHIRGTNSMAWQGKLKTVWKQETFQELLDGIRGQQIAINTLIQLLQMDSLMEISKLLKQRAPELKRSAQYTDSLRRSRPFVRTKVRESVFSQEDRISVYSAADSMMARSELEFDFDDIVVNSGAYRRALAAARQQDLPPHTEETQSDLIDFSDDATLRRDLIDFSDDAALRRTPTKDQACDLAALSTDLLGLSFLTDIDESTFVVDSPTELQHVEKASNSRDTPVIASVKAPAEIEIVGDPVTSQGQPNYLSSDADTLVRSRSTTPMPSSPSPDITRSRSTSVLDKAIPSQTPDTPMRQVLNIDQSPKATQPSSTSAQTNIQKTSDVSDTISGSEGLVEKNRKHRTQSAGAMKETSSTHICGGCRKPLTEQVVRALGQTYHSECFTCQDCGKIVASKFFPFGEAPNNYPLCETDYFKRLSLLCHDCGCALRGKYVSALDRRYHFEHFHCDACAFVFGESDSYYEHEGNVYCFEHYTCMFAQICTGCDLPIIEQFTEIERNGVNKHWHLDCYGIHKYWNVECGAISMVKRVGGLWTDRNGNITGFETVRRQYEATKATIARIWNALSSFEERSAAAIADILSAASNGRKTTFTRIMSSFLVKTEVLFRALDNVNKRELQGSLNASPSYQRGARLFYKQCMILMTGQSGFRNPGSAARPGTMSVQGVRNEHISYATGLAHCLKLLIRIGLFASLRDLRPFLQDMSQSDDGPARKATLSLANAEDNCAACRKPIEDACYKNHLGQSWHCDCLECASCHRSNAFVTTDLLRESSHTVLCRFCKAEPDQTLHRVTRLQQYGYLLWVALARYIEANNLDFSVLDDVNLKQRFRKDPKVLEDVECYAESARVGERKERSGGLSLLPRFSYDQTMFTLQTCNHERRTSYEWRVHTLFPKDLHPSLFS